ncbi:hypothetical protein [Halomontanus rarus]|uniref:hypothetical protein n=1 Tax=Halomontanus rarus TaxID=3034020 RepID=UPI001A988B98
MCRVQTVLDRYADGTPYEQLAAAFLDLERWTGDDPVLLLAEAAASTTGQGYFTGVKPTVERFRETFVDAGRAKTFDELAALRLEDDALVEVFGAERKRHVLLEAARVFAERPAADDLEALQSWAGSADYYRYDEDPIGRIGGVGPATFQYLRMLAGVDTAKPDPAVTSFVETVGDEIESPSLDASDPRRAVASCEWLAIASSYRTIEIDQLAWWLRAGADEREAALASQQL